ncbi:hypothetical protein [Mycoplasma struthionis]|uniref:Uncharacterized protein n=1 Tax=Mycoplasma struthionis TaxID=538220 RepID=A0A502M1H1_9MOLU|nr:hypothetical protein [Mycoplasma struthionis]TPI01158.1 hypothetical protein FJM01_03010 [Mycoplasma struthionis]
MEKTYLLENYIFDDKSYNINVILTNNKYMYAGVKKSQIYLKVPKKYNNLVNIDSFLKNVFPKLLKN